MNNYMKVRFADGVVANVLGFNIEDLLFGNPDVGPEIYAETRIMSNRINVEQGKWRNTYIFEPRPKKVILLLEDGINTTTQLIPGIPTYCYTLLCASDSRRIEIIWYDDAPPVYAGIYDVFQKITEQVEFNRYAKE